MLVFASFPNRLAILQNPNSATILSPSSSRASPLLAADSASRVSLPQGSYYRGVCGQQGVQVSRSPQRNPATSGTRQRAGRASLPYRTSSSLPYRTAPCSTASSCSSTSSSSSSPSTEPASEHTPAQLTHGLLLARVDAEGADARLAHDALVCALGAQRPPCRS